MDNLPKPPNYKKEYKKELKKQIQKIRDDVSKNKRNMVIKIENFCEKFDRKYENVKQKILDENDDLFYLFFVKDPTRLRIHEKLAASYIKSLPFVSNFTDSSTDAQVISNGAVQSKKSLKESGGETTAKTIDFTWTCGNKTFHATHKYTKQGGGNQDNQYADLQRFIEQANKSVDPKKYFIAIPDGEYYFNMDSSTGVTRGENLSQIANSSRRVYAMRIDELADFLIKICDL